jgi:hypothetical protein
MIVLGSNYSSKVHSPILLCGFPLLPLSKRLGVSQGRSLLEGVDLGSLLGFRQGTHAVQLVRTSYLVDNWSIQLPVQGLDWVSTPNRRRVFRFRRHLCQS